MNAFYVIKKVIIVLFILLSMSMICSAQKPAQEPMTNNDVVEMVKAQFAVDTIIKKIQTTSLIKFDTSTEALKVLKKAGVDEKVLIAMMDREAMLNRTNNASANNAPQVVYEVGSDGVLREVASKDKKFSVKESFFTFDLKTCKNSGGDIVCNLMITNNDKLPKVIRFWYESLMLDDKGNQYKASELKLANTEGTRLMTLAFDAPVNARVVFNNVSSQPTSIKLLTLWFDLRPQGEVYAFGAGRPIKVEFRDISIMK